MKKLTLSAILLGSLFLAACSDVKTDEEVNQIIEDKEADLGEALDKEITFDILKNEHVVDAYVEQTKTDAKAVIVLKESTDEDEQQEILKSYGEELTIKYPDLNTNVIVTYEEE